jgi:glyoxylase-like metal-dependent hydrolase (beta-lactamase superfamily II)
MNIKEVPTLSRRGFIAAAIGSTAAMLTTRQLFALGDGIVPMMLKEAAGARINIHPLRRKISVLEGSGGNIAVLTGRDGTLLIDAGFTVSRSRISDALGSITSDPIKYLINTHWHIDQT